MNRMREREEPFLSSEKLCRRDSTWLPGRVKHLQSTLSIEDMRGQTELYN